MSKFKNIILNQPLGLIVLVIALAFILLFGIGLALISGFATIKHAGLYLDPICFNADCVERLVGKLQPSLNIARATLDVGVAFATMGGILIALLSYINSSSNAALTNHIEHLKIFLDYAESEVEKHDRLLSANFDVIFLYGKIFDQSRLGKTTVSDDYRIFLVDLNKILEESNERCTVGTPGGFSYKDHQRRVRDHLVSAGITIYLAPRNDYFEMEKQMFSFLSRINQSFCPFGTLPNIVLPSYY
ncbi:hypothetical protein E9531_16885 [Lampropedia puyangensis]|uniref:Uncharacterized protein n=1 Tax=Lampropedia puyangensis TaxID=1330072 RepID=A0A4S8EPB8_9BURK|nr:retron Ec48 family effector membrane protein [Lampropedia puyangensis]THT96058.1 hypothetical protein E9531_16885 [Lampropedia puyangensis]